ncbi:MAG: hypothetical protein QGG01_11245 [Roseibacillus sp.]|nr:hypothetical protein [Roseibacillus sp.]
MLPPSFASILPELCTQFRASLLADAEGVEFPELLSVEEAVLDFTQQLGKALLQQFVTVRAQQALDLRTPCPCGRRKEVLSRRSWPRTTLFGPVSVPDPYTYCRICHDAERPARAYLGTERERYSLSLQSALVDLVSDESAQKAVDKLHRHHPNVTIDRNVALRMLHHHGAQARSFVDEKLERARSEAADGLLPFPPAAELEAQYDASLIPVATLEAIPTPAGQEPKRTPVRGLPLRRKNTRWQEAKMGLVQTPDNTHRLYALRPTSQLDAAFDDVFGLSCLLGWTPQTAVRGISDGAPYIHTRLQEVFSLNDFQFILDRPHCKEHLSSAGKALEVHTGISGSVWAKEALVMLERGDSDAVVSQLWQAYEASGDTAETRTDLLRLQAGFFERNADAVAYGVYREQGWSTASSEVESGHRHVVQSRVKISGAWWDPGHVDDILSLRMLKANGWWQEYWCAQCEKWKRRAEGFASSRPPMAVDVAA